LLSDDHDLVFDGRDLATVSDPEAIPQNIKQRLLHFTREWFLDLNAGTPWIEEILTKGSRQSAVKDILKARIREAPGVEELTALELFEAGERGIRVEFSARTATGVVSDALEVSL